MRSFVSSDRQILLSLVAYAARYLAAGWRREFHARAARAGQTNGNGLSGRARSMFAFANVPYLLANKFPCLGGG
jgi:hypothetical protein